MCKKQVNLNEDIWLMAKKMRLKMKNRSSRYNINTPRRWHGHKYTKYKICLDGHKYTKYKICLDGYIY